MLKVASLKESFCDPLTAAIKQQTRDGLE